MSRLPAEHSPAHEPPFKVRGSLHLHADLTASLVDVLGHFSTSGKLTTDRLKISGDCRIAQMCQAGKVDILGSLRVHSVQAEQVSASGYLSATGKITAVTFQATGGLQMHCLSAAEIVEIRLSSRSFIDTLSSSGTVKVRRAFPPFHWLTGFLQRLECRLIEGAAIELEHTTAKLVNGERIRIGPGCTIQEVRYSESLHIDKRSTVVAVIPIVRTGGQVK